MGTLSLCWNGDTDGSEPFSTLGENVAYKSWTGWGFRVPKDLQREIINWSVSAQRRAPEAAPHRPRVYSGYAIPRILSLNGETVCFVSV